MKTTYKGKTAGAILKTASVIKTQAGTTEIRVVLPDGQVAIAMCGERSDGFGGRVADVLVIANVDGIVARLSTSARAYNHLRQLEHAADKGLRD